MPKKIALYQLSAACQRKIAKCHWTTTSRRNIGVCQRKFALPHWTATYKKIAHTNELLQTKEQLIYENKVMHAKKDCCM
jgi:hypothetical protein